MKSLEAQKLLDVNEYNIYSHMSFYLQDIAATASLELVECFGQFDPATSSQFLALFQVCMQKQNNLVEYTYFHTCDISRFRRELPI